MKTKNLPGVIAKTPTLVFFLWIICSFAFGTNITMAPDEIRFDYDNASYTFDAFTIRNGTGGTADVPEWYPFDDRNNPVAYIKGQMNRKIEVRFASNFSGTVHLILKLSIFSGNSIGTICNLFIPNYDTSSGDYRTLNLSGTLPNIVSKQTFTWKWEIYAIPVNATGYCAAWTTTNTTHTYYTLLAVPQTPMVQPWVSVLDYACTWANGQTDSANTAQKVTEGIYNLGDTDGDIDFDEFSYYTTNVRQFYLTGFLENIDNSSSVLVNCDDIANFFTICTLALGLNSESKRILKQIQPPFNTNPIDPIGLGDSLYTPAWSKHHYGWFNGMVFDPCLKIGTTLPTNIAQGTYERALIPSSFLPPYHYYNYDVGGVTIF